MSNRQKGDGSRYWTYQEPSVTRNPLKERIMLNFDTVALARKERSRILVLANAADNLFEKSADSFEEIATKLQGDAS